MRRRDFIKVIGSGAVAWPLVARAQQPERMRRIAVLMGYPENDLEGPVFFAAFREGLQKLGWKEGRNIRLDTRWASPGDAETRQRLTRRATTRSHSFGCHTHHGRAPATYAHHPHRFR